MCCSREQSIDNIHQHVKNDPSTVELSGSDGSTMLLLDGIYVFLETS